MPSAPGSKEVGHVVLQRSRHLAFLRPETDLRPHIVRGFGQGVKSGDTFSAACRYQGIAALEIAGDRCLPLPDLGLEAGNLGPLLLLDADLVR
jgi:hypothetical protein